MNTALAFALLALAQAAATPPLAAADLPRLAVSENKRFLVTWSEAINQSGAAQMRHAKNLLLSRPYLTRIPADDVIVEGMVKTAMPGAGRYRFAATRDSAGGYALVYAPVGREFKVRMDKISGAKVKAWWFDPRTGKATLISEFPNTGARAFTSPDRNEDRDWILVLDDAARDFPPPGALARSP